MPAIVGGDAAARGHAVLAGQHRDRVAQADVPVSQKTPLTTAVFVKSGERSEMIISDFGYIFELFEVFGFICKVTHETKGQPKPRDLSFTVQIKDCG